MPVMVTGVDNAVGARAVRLLAARAGEVRAFVQAGVPGHEALAEHLRGLRCKVAHGDLDDEAHVETALEQVHTVLHLLGRPTDDPEAHLDRTATVVGAAIGAGCRRIVLLSDLAVGLPTTPPERADLAGNAWLAALAEAEGLVADAPLEGLVLRCAVIHGPDDPLTTALAAGALGPDPAGAHWPVAAVDVAATAVLADAERDLDTSLHVVVEVAGPVRYTTAAYVDALRGLVAAGPGDSLPGHAVQLLTAVVERPEGALGTAGTALEAAWA